jgi:hypothetical protein
MKCEIEIFLNGSWQKAASFKLKNETDLHIGIKGAGYFEYDLSYAIEHLNSRAIGAVSCLYPVNLELHSTSAWPSFLLDILPSGANRRYFLNELGIPNNPEADWPLLLKGAGNPPGNIRIAEAASPPAEALIHEGFTYDEVVDRAEYFIEYARENNAPVIAQFSSRPTEDIKEFIFRDILNVAMGNTDNHGRNTAMLKFDNGNIRLAPLFDFAPMFLDDQGIPRMCRWTGAEYGGIPEWGKVANLLKDLHVDTKQLRTELAGFAETIIKLPEIMEHCGVDLWLIDRLIDRTNNVQISLNEAKPGK